MKIWLDDNRPAPKGWRRARLYSEVIRFLRTGKVTELSLDYDLGKNRKTGYDVLLWIEEAVMTRGYRPPPVLKVHSGNIVGHERMLAAVRAIERRRNS